MEDSRRGWLRQRGIWRLVGAELEGEIDRRGHSGYSFARIRDVSAEILTRCGCPHRLAWPRTPPFHGGNRGSNPLGDTKSPFAPSRAGKLLNARQVTGVPNPDPL